MSLINERLLARAAEAAHDIGLVVDDGDDATVLTWRQLEAQTARWRDRLVGAAADQINPCLVVGIERNDPPTVCALVAALRCPYPVVVHRRGGSAESTEQLSGQLAERGLTAIAVEDGTVCPPAATPTRLPADAIVLASGGSSAGRPRLIVDTAMRTASRRPDSVRPVYATGWRAGQRQLVVSPLHHASGITYFIEGLADGNVNVVPAFFRPAVVSDLVERWAVEWAQLVPYHLTQVRAGEPNAHQWRTVRGILHLAATCPARVKRFWHGLLGPDRVHEMYNASERIGMTLASGVEWEERPGTVGRGFFTHIQILDDDFEPLPAGETGEIYMRSGRRTTRPYLGSGGRLRATPDGFATLGDIGRMDADGYLWLAARQIASISVGGVTVLPAEVEAVLLEHPAVLDVAVAATPDPTFGERPLALVVARPDRPPARTLRAWARVRLTETQLPSRIEFVDRLPRTDAGKLNRPELARLAAAVTTPTARG